MKINWINDVRGCVNSTKGKTIITIKGLIKELNPRITEGLVDILKQQGPSGKIFLNEKRGNCPRYSLRTKPLSKWVCMEDPDRVVEDPMGITTIVYKDGGCEVKDKTVWLDFSRDPSHVILVTLFPNGAPADIFIFPLK